MNHIYIYMYIRMYCPMVGWGHSSPPQRAPDKVV
jgi:hypothetical protein